jgi:hypothetical protein
MVVLMKSKKTERLTGRRRADALTPTARIAC